LPKRVSKPRERNGEATFLRRPWRLGKMRVDRRWGPRRRLSDEATMFDYCTALTGDKRMFYPTTSAREREAMPIPIRTSFWLLANDYTFAFAPG
jgi:hypothetical protein